MSEDCLKVYVLYESSDGVNPHGCSEIRLLRPLSHSVLHQNVELTYGQNLPEGHVDVVIVERLWGMGEAHQTIILEEIYNNGTTVIFEIDDDLLSLEDDYCSFGPSLQEKKMWLRWMVRIADGVIVSTDNLALRLDRLNKNIVVVPNQLDDRLFQRSREFKPPSPRNKLVCGYMGTHTHIYDLLSIAGPLRNILYRHKENLTLEIVGVGDQGLINGIFPDLPVNIHSVPMDMVQYPKFTSWMQENLRWDFAIAPLVDSEFTQSKSDIKFLDYAVQGIPAIFSDVPAYNNTVQHMETGMLAQSTYSSWLSCLERMVTDSEIRTNVAKNAHDFVWKERMLSQKAGDWFNAIKHIKQKSRNRKKFIPLKKMEKVKPAVIELGRNEKILNKLNKNGVGLEVGPSFSPVAPKSEGYNVEILDHADAETLQTKYQGHDVDVSRIESVDYVWSGEPLNELTGKKGYYDWIIASHVVEHTPDLVSFLKQCEDMLKTGGVLSLVIPDYRYCFDKFRGASTPGDVIQAYLEKRSRHNAGVIWDHYSMITQKGGIVSWGVGHPGEYSLNHSVEQASQMFTEAQESESYIDVHNWRFTPSSFELILNDIVLLEYCGLTVKSVFPTSGCEFFVQLEKLEQPHAMECSESKRCSLLERILEETLVND